jgi:hypothetical protein
MLELFRGVFQHARLVGGKVYHYTLIVHTSILDESIEYSANDDQKNQVLLE